MYNFQNCLGQERIIKSMQNDIKFDRVSHAYLIVGENSVTWELANAFAKALVCEERRTVACDVCFSCHAADSANHPDILTVAPTKTKSIGVLDVREQMVAPSLIKPYRAPYKIFLIPRADTMTAEAQNAILKSIEEPNGYCVFILLAQNINLFLPTILSRCLLQKALPFSHENLVRYLKDKGISGEQASVYAAFADGSVEKAEKLLQSETFSSIREQVIEICTSLPRKDAFYAFESAKKLEALKDQLPLVLTTALLFYRDILLSKKKQTGRFVWNQDKQSILTQMAKELSDRYLYNAIGGITKAEQALARNANPLLTLENMLLTDFRKRNSE